MAEKYFLHAIVIFDLTSLFLITENSLIVGYAGFPSSVHTKYGFDCLLFTSSIAHLVLIAVEEKN